jgi:AraC family transcriptional regulator
MNPMHLSHHPQHLNQPAHQPHWHSHGVDEALRAGQAPAPARAPGGERATAPALQGLQAYGRALQAAGGKPVQTRLQREDCSAVGVALYAAPPYDLQVPALPVSRLVVALTASCVGGGLDGERHATYQSARYALFHIPAGAPARWHKPSPSRHLTLYFDAAALAEDDTGPRALGVGGPPMLNLGLPGIRPLVDELVRELEGAPGWAAEAADSLGRLLLIKVARQQARRHEAANPLTPHRLARLQDHVRAHLAERLLVSDLAAVAGLSPHRLTQAIVAATGQSPHQFVLAQRLQQAQALLRQGGTALADVAAACGFASQQHLTLVMRQRLGTTPARYRRACHGRAHAAA